MTGMSTSKDGHEYVKSARQEMFFFEWHIKKSKLSEDLGLFTKRRLTYEGMDFNGWFRSRYSFSRLCFTAKARLVTCPLLALLHIFTLRDSFASFDVTLWSVTLCSSR